jgi:hypothetical protein
MIFPNCQYCPKGRSGTTAVCPDCPYRDNERKKNAINTIHYVVQYEDEERYEDHSYEIVGIFDSEFEAIECAKNYAAKHELLTPIFQKGEIIRFENTKRGDYVHIVLFENKTEG